MKKLIIILFALILVFSLAACNDNFNYGDSEDNTTANDGENENIDKQEEITDKEENENIDKQGEMAMDNNNPEIITFQTHLNEYSVLGLETKTLNGTVGNWGERWGVFFNNNSMEKIKPYIIDEALLGLFCQSEPGYYNYLIGAMVDGVQEAPDGLYLETFPASEYFVVTHEWVETMDYADNQMGRIVGAAHDNALSLPDGYEKYGDPVMFIERYNYRNDENKFRSEVWLAIRKD